MYVQQEINHEIVAIIPWGWQTKTVGRRWLELMRLIGAKRAYLQRSLKIECVATSQMKQLLVPLETHKTNVLTLDIL